MIGLLMAATAFVGSHFALSSTSLRDVLVARLGERGFTLLFSALSLAALAWLAQSFSAATPGPLLWHLPGAGHGALAAMPVALLLLAAGLVNPNPTAVLQPVPGTDWRPRGIQTVTRHPVMWAFGLWALLHLLANGDLAGLILFGSVAVLALAGTRAIEAKKRRRWPAGSWERYAAATSNLPFLAILQGRTRFDWKGIGWQPPLIAAALWGAIVLWFHPVVLGTPVLPG